MRERTGQTSQTGQTRPTGPTGPIPGEYAPVPTEPGWYWWRARGEVTPPEGAVMVRVWRREEGLAFVHPLTQKWRPAVGGLWCGPLAKPGTVGSC